MITNGWAPGLRASSRVTLVFQSASCCQICRPCVWIIYERTVGCEQSAPVGPVDLTDDSVDTANGNELLDTGLRCLACEVERALDGKLG